MNRYFMFSADSDVGVQEVCGIIVAVGEAMSGKAPEAIGLKQASSKPHVSVCYERIFYHLFITGTRAWEFPQLSDS
jgi:hypothetical protein